MTAAYTVDPKRALPTDAYRPEAHETDRDLVFRAGWVWVGTADQVEAPGDYFSTVVSGQPIIVLRNQAGILTALSNMCAHRGTLLVDGPGNTKRFQCPYHAWTYRDDGTLVSVPFAAADALDRTEHCLPNHRAEEWHGLVFVSLDRHVPSVAERLAHLDAIVGDAGMRSLHHWTADRGDEVWEANWKLVISNAMESYHLFKVHDETLEPITPTSGAYYLTGNADGAATGGATRGGPDYTLLSLPPNFVGILTGDALLWQAVEPLAADRSRVITGGAYRTPSPERSSGLTKWASKAMSKAAELGLPDFLPEDRAICERGQRTAGGDFDPGVLVPMEQVLVDFHHFLARQLHGTPTPPVRTSAEVGVPRGTGARPDGRGHDERSPRGPSAGDS